MRIPAVLYAAKSTQDKHASIPKQLADGRKKCDEEDWEIIGGPGIGEFKDEKFSAFTGNRGPDLKAAMVAAERAAEETGQICMLVCQHSDRFARGAGDRPGAADSLIEIWHRMRRVNVHLRSFQNDMMMSKPVLVAVAAEQAYEESKRKSDAVKNGMRERRSKGLPQGGKRRLGYQFVKGEGLLVPDETERLIVARVYDEFLAGRTDEAIARDLLVEGVPTAEGGRWYGATVREILLNPLYKGWLSTKEGVIQGQHEPCIDSELWQQAQDLRRRRAQSSPGGGRGRRSSGKHLFRKGTLRCGICGGPMTPRTTRPGKSRPGRKISETYICLERKCHPDLCSMTPVKRELVDGAVFNYFETVALDVEATKAQLAEAHDRKLSEVRALSEQARAEQHRAEARLAKVRRDYTDDRITAEDWASFRDELTADLKAANAEVDRLASQASESEEWAGWVDAERETLHKLASLRAVIAGELSSQADLDAVRASLTQLFDHFVIKKVESGTRVHAELAWVGGYILEPVIREEVIEGHTPLRPVFRRETIYDPGAAIQGSPSSCLAPPPPTASPTP
jgi:DNA invertase Pin-like site-specific DNA recombinase